MEREIRNLLNKILPRLLENPKLMFGYDTSKKEVDEIIETGKLPIEVLQNLGGDHFFLLHADKFDITKEDRRDLDFYLEHRIKKDENEIKEIFEFLR